MIVGIRKDTGFRFVHPKPTHGPNAEQPYVTVGEALAGVENVKFNNEEEKRARQVSLVLVPRGSKTGES